MTPAKAGVRSLAVAAIANLGLVAAAVAAPIPATYDALDELDVSFSILQGTAAFTAGATPLLESKTGDGEVDGDNKVDEGTQGQNGFFTTLFLHVFGTGTGSSSSNGSASFTVGLPGAGPGFVSGTGVGFVLQVMTNEAFTSNTFNVGNVPGATATSFAPLPTLTLTAIGGGFSQIDCSTVTPTAQGLSFAPMCFAVDAGLGVTVSGAVSGEAFTPSVPEPASLALIGLGLAGLAASRRRKTN